MDIVDIIAVLYHRKNVIIVYMYVWPLDDTVVAFVS